MSLTAVERFYDNHAAIIKNRYQPYNAVVLDSSIEQHFIRLFSFAGLKNNAKVLDIGCGNGFLLNHIADKFMNCDLHGIDLSQKQLSYCQNIKTYHGDIQKINIHDKYDFIFCMEMIGYTTNQFETIDKILSMLNPNGVFICSSFIYCNEDSWQQNIVKHKITSINKEDGYYYNQISIDKLKQYNIEIYNDKKNVNFYYFNFAEKRGLFWQKEEVLKKHRLFKIKN